MKWLLFVTVTQALGATCPHPYVDFLRDTPTVGMDGICISPETDKYTFKTKDACEQAAARIVKSLNKHGHAEYVCFVPSGHFEELEDDTD